MLIFAVSPCRFSPKLKMRLGVFNIYPSSLMKVLKNLNSKILFSVILAVGLHVKYLSGFVSFRYHTNTNITSQLFVNHITRRTIKFQNVKSNFFNKLNPSLRYFTLYFALKFWTTLHASSDNERMYRTGSSSLAKQGFCGSLLVLAIVLPIYQSLKEKKC